MQSEKFMDVDQGRCGTIEDCGMLYLFAIHSGIQMRTSDVIGFERSMSYSRDICYFAGLAILLNIIN